MSPRSINEPFIVSPRNAGNKRNLKEPNCFRSKYKLSELQLLEEWMNIVCNKNI